MVESNRNNPIEENKQETPVTGQFVVSNPNLGDVDPKFTKMIDI